MTAGTRAPFHAGATVSATALLTAVLMLLAPALPAAGAAPPKLEAKSWALIDARTGETLAASARKRRLPMASTTKMMTAYLAVRDLPLGKMVKATDYSPIPGESLMGLEPGQKVSVRDLLYGVSLLSGNDAAQTLAVADAGSVSRFVRKMNRTARRLGLKDTRFENPIGLDGKSQFSSAADLVTLGRALMGVAKYRPIASARSAKLTSYRPPVTIESTNDFVVDNEWAKGIKTGHTFAAGYVLVSDGRRRATELIGSVMGAPSDAARDGESVRLMDYGFSLYTKRVPIRPGRKVTSVPVKYSDDALGLVARRPVRIGVRKGETLRTTYLIPDEVTGPVGKGTPIGRAVVRLDGEKIGIARLTAAREVTEATLLDKARYWLIPGLILIGVLISVILGLYALYRRRQSAKLQKRLERMSRSRE